MSMIRKAAARYLRGLRGEAPYLSVQATCRLYGVPTCALLGFLSGNGQ
jgi:hypothetical protein